jgi:O-antigen ligase
VTSAAVGGGGGGGAGGGGRARLRAVVPATTLALFLPLAVVTPQTLSGLLVVAAPLCLLGAGPPRPPGRRWRPALGAAAALIGWGLLSPLWSIAPADSLIQAAKLVGWLALGLTLVLTAARLDEPARRRAETALLAGFAVGLALLLVEALADQPLNRLVAAAGLRTPSENAANRGATTLALLLGPMFALLWRRGRRGAALLFVPVAALALLGLNSIAAIAGSVGGLLALVLVAWRGRPAALAIAALFAGLVLAAPALHLTVLRAPEAGSPLRALPITSQSRLVTWEFAAKRTLERPVTGHGLRAYRHLDMTYGRGEFPYRRAVVNTALRLTHPHNVAVQAWLELGAVGALLLALLILALFDAASADAEVPRAVAAGRAAALVAYLIVGLSAYGAEQSQWIATAWLVAAALALAPSGGGAARPPH